MIGRRIICAVAMTLAGIGAVGPAVAQSEYPVRPVKMIWPYAAGGVGDIVARLIAESASEELGQRIIVENVTGAGGSVGVQGAAQSDPDGYTILQISAGNALLPIVQNVQYDLARDFTPIYGVGTVPYVFAVKSTSEYKNIDDLKATAAKDTVVTYGSGSVGSASHLGSAWLSGVLGITANHIPYRGFTGAVQALMSGEVDFVAVTYVDVAQLVKSGEVRVLAVSSESRLSDIPDVPTLTDLGYDLKMATWYAYLSPKGTPEAINKRLHDALAAAAQKPEVVERLEQIGLVIDPSNPEEVSEKIVLEAKTWSDVLSKYNIDPSK